MTHKLYNHFFVKAYTFTRIQFDLIAVFFIALGITVGSFITLSDYIIPRIFASTSPWTQTDWSGGSSSGTVNSTVTTFASSSNVDTTTTSGQFSLTEASGWSATYSDWTRRKAVTVTNSGSAQTDYQVRLSLTYDSDMQSDFDDIRFANSSGTALDYWIQTKTDSTTAVVWVEVDTLNETGDTTLYMYYGNSSVSSDSNGDNTFILFDDFSSGSIDSGKWTISGSSSFFSVVGGELKIGEGGSGWVKSLFSTDTFARSDLSFEMQYRWTSSNSSYDALMMGWHDSGTGANYTDLVYAYYNSGTGTCTSGCPVNVYEDGTNRGGISGTWSVNQQYTNRVRMKSSGGAYYEQSTDDGDNWTTSYNSSYSTESNLRPGFALYSGVHMYDDLRVRKWMSSEPTSVFDSEVNKYESTGVLTSNIFNSEFPADWGTLAYTTSGNGTITVKVRTDSASDMSGADSWSSCSNISSDTDLSDDTCVTDADQYLQYQVSLTPNGADTPVFEDISIVFSASDQVAPTTNASSIAMSTSSTDGRSVGSGEWNSGTTPYFAWTAGADNDGGSGLKGYCLYIGTDSEGDPATTSGLLANSPVSTSGTTCGFVASGTNIDLSGASYLSSALTSGATYYLNVKAIDSANNIFSGTSASFTFDHDSTAPINVSYISTPGSNFSNVVDMSFSWPTSAASDAHAGVLGYQYQINGTDGVWKGTSTDSTCSADYIPSGTGSYTLTVDDDSASITEGNNVVYFRTIDTACNISSVSTYRTGNLAFAGEAPAFEASCEAESGIIVTPLSSETNSYSLSWDAATPALGQSITNYYYMINTSPPSSLSTITSNTSTYIDNDTTTSISTGKLVGAVKGSNTAYVVAVDDADNYSASNCLKGTFTLNSTLPDPPLNVSVTDASIKSSSLWRASIGWDVPAYTGTGSLTYKVQRSTDNANWTDVTSTTGTSYIDTVTGSSLHYWRVGAYDTSSESQVSPSFATAVSLTPKGTYTSAPDVSSGPTVTTVTTKQATVSWSTTRNADSKVQFGTGSGSYYTEEPSNSIQTTDHTITITGLEPGTTYYYKAKWTDEDGNTGTSVEKTFETDPAPTVSSVTESNIGLTNVFVNFSINNTSKVSVYYGKTSSYGGIKEVSTSNITGDSEQTIQLTDLEDGTLYHYKLVLEDAEEEQYEFEDHSFETLPRPKITNVRIQQVKGTAEPTVLVSWITNTEVSSIVTYYPQGNTTGARDEVNVARKKGEHQMIVKGLDSKTEYSLIVKGRDKIGNEASSDTNRFTTATDTRPPKISQLKVEGSIKGNGSSGETDTQLIVSWNTDEPASSQIEFGEGTGATYSSRTQEDTNLTLNHVVIISGLTPSKVYHLRTISFDLEGNIGNSIDTVTITPKATRSALDLVISNLSGAFGFLGRIR